MHSSIAKFSTSSLALAAALLATPVFAQDTNVVDQADSSNEIVVTAQRREQDATRVPISIELTRTRAGCGAISSAISQGDAISSATSSTPALELLSRVAEAAAPVEALSPSH